MNARYFLTVGFLLLFAIGCAARVLVPAASASTLEGRVVKVSDGDTITILTNEEKQIKIRLASIDAPETGQDFGRRSQEALAELVAGKAVTVLQEDVDRYGRIVGTVYVGNLNANATMVSNGMAWVYRQYAPKKSPLYKLEEEAREAKRGLWSHPNPIPPWKFRADKRKAPSRAEVKNNGIADTECGEKRYCREMVTCDEAMMYFKECGLSSLDGDGDGVPCETLCK